MNQKVLPLKLMTAKMLTKNKVILSVLLDNSVTDILVCLSNEKKYRQGKCNNATIVHY